MSADTTTHPDTSATRWDWPRTLRSTPARIRVIPDGAHATPTPPPPHNPRHTPRMDRLDLELYAERLGAYRERILDALADARMREGWRDFEADARIALTASEVTRLEQMGVLARPDCPVDSRDEVRERTADLAALDRLLVRVERERRRL